MSELNKNKQRIAWSDTKRVVGEGNEVITNNSYCSPLANDSSKRTFHVRTAQLDTEKVEDEDEL